jgi:outer membrane protein
VKNLSLILNAILIVAVGFLYYDEFSDDNDETNESVNQQDTAVENHSIAYVNSDSLLAKYHYYEEVSKQLELKRNKLQQEYTRRAEGLQKQIEDYQRTVSNLTIAQARAVEEDLGRKRQNLLQYQETISQELMKEEAKITQELYDKVSAYLKTYGEENNLQLVLTYSTGSGLLYANDALNITSQVIEGLNQVYTEESLLGAADTTATN